MVKTVSTSNQGLKELIETCISVAGKKQKAVYLQGDIDLYNKESVEAADRKRFDFV